MGCGLEMRGSGSPDWHQHMWVFTPLPLPMFRLASAKPAHMQVGAAEKGLVSFRGFALGQLPKGQADIFKLVRHREPAAFTLATCCSLYQWAA